jgi:hypothetical protein
VKFQFLGQPSRLLRFKSLIETGLVVRVEVIHHQHDLGGVGLPFIAELPDDPLQLFTFPVT